MSVLVRDDTTAEGGDTKRKRKRGQSEDTGQPAAEQAPSVPSATSGNGGKPEVTEDGNERLGSPASWSAGAASVTSFMSSAGVVGGTAGAVTVASVAAGTGLGGLAVRKYAPAFAEKVGLKSRKDKKDRKGLADALGNRKGSKNGLGKLGLGSGLPGLGGKKGAGLPGLGGKKSGAGLPGLGKGSGSGKGVLGKLGSGSGSGKGLLGKLGSKLAGRGGKNGLGAGSGKGKGALGKLLGTGGKGGLFGGGKNGSGKGLLGGLFGGNGRGSKGGLGGLFGGGKGSKGGLFGGKGSGGGLLGKLFGGKNSGGSGAGSGKGVLGKLAGAGKSAGKKTGAGLAGLGAGLLGAGRAGGRGISGLGSKLKGKLAGRGSNDGSSGGSGKGKGLFSRLGSGARKAGQGLGLLGLLGLGGLGKLFGGTSDDTGGDEGTGSSSGGSSWFGNDAGRGNNRGSLFGFFFGGTSDAERSANRDGRKAAQQAARNGGSSMPDPFAQHKEQVNATANGLEITKANDLVDWVKHAPGAASAEAEAWQKQAHKIQEDITVNPAFTEALNSFANASRGLAGQMAEHSAQFEVQHAEELNKIRNPRPGQSKWDISQNQD